jgi:outer membrane protein
MVKKLGWLSVLLALASASSVQAADMGVAAAPPAANAWVITIGADARAIPRYPGSNAFGMTPIPYFDMARPGSPEKFHGPIDGLGFALFDNNVVAIGPVGSLIWQRKQSYSSSLNGLGNIGYTLNLGGFMDYWVVPWLRTRAEVMQGVGEGSGVTGRLFADAVLPLSPAMTWSVGARGRYVTAGTEKPYYSITPAQSLATGYPVYHAGSGWQAVGAGTQLKYRFNPSWATYGFVEYEKLIGPTEDSPIVTGPGGSANQWTFGVGVTYSFTMTNIPFLR